MLGLTPISATAIAALLGVVTPPTPSVTGGGPDYYEGRKETAPSLRAQILKEDDEIEFIIREIYASWMPR